MDSEARVSIDITWSAPDADLSENQLLAEVRESIANAPGVSTAKVFLISRHQAVIRIESQASREQLAEQLGSAFGPDFELQLLVDGGPCIQPGLVVMPNSDE